MCTLLVGGHPPRDYGASASGTVDAPPATAVPWNVNRGSQAVELVLQAALAHAARSMLLPIENSYHGCALGMLGIGASEARDTVPNLLQTCHELPRPLDAAALSRLETQLERRDVAALVMEAVIINSGVLIPGPAFMTGLQELCRRYGTLLVADEVATGFGRTGRGATVASAEVETPWRARGASTSPTAGTRSPRRCRSAASTVSRNEERLTERVEATSGLVRERPEGMRFPEPPEPGHDARRPGATTPFNAAPVDSGN